MASTTSNLPMDPNGPTGKLCLWIDSINLSDIPQEIQTRAKYLILDGIACALVGAHLPWSEKAAQVIVDMEGAGKCDLFGWDRKISPLSAALLNSTFTQGFELDDWHAKAPIHSNSIILPALFAASSSSSTPISGSSFLLSYLVGLEVAPRVGKAMYGEHMLTMGWHSGAVFGPSASAAAVSKMLALPADQIEDALGIACTQGCGLMSAQFESEVKRMQHGFAARNGLMAAMLAKGGYLGIKKVFEREYGGFLDMFSKGNGKEPQFLEDKIYAGLGEEWETTFVKVKPYSAMAATHGVIDCVRILQQEHPEEMKDLGEVEEIVLSLGEAAFAHGGQNVQRPLTTTGAQMSAKYVAATQMIDGVVLPPCFRYDMLNRNNVWGLVEKIKTVRKINKDYIWESAVEIRFKDGKILKAQVEAARGVSPDLTNKEIVEKFRGLMRGVIGGERRDEIEKICLGIDSLEDVTRLSDLLAGLTENPIA